MQIYFVSKAFKFYYFHHSGNAKTDILNEKCISFDSDLNIQKNLEMQVKYFRRLCFLWNIFKFWEFKILLYLKNIFSQTCDYEFLNMYDPWCCFSSNWIIEYLTTLFLNRCLASVSNLIRDKFPSENIKILVRGNCITLSHLGIV